MSTYLIRLGWRLNDIIRRLCLELCLAHRKYSINIWLLWLIFIYQKRTYRFISPLEDVKHWWPQINNTNTYLLKTMCLISFKKWYKLSHLNHIIWGWNSFLCFTDEETEEQRGLTTCSWSHKTHILIFHKQLSRGRIAIICIMCHWPWYKSFHQLQPTKVVSLNAELGRGEHNRLR